MRNFFFTSIFACISLSSYSQSLKQQRLYLLLEKHSDSINNFLKYNKVPVFLEDSCFDYNPYYWPTLHNPISLRALVLKKVDNLEALNSLIAIDDPLFKGKCSLKYEILKIMPGISKSFYDLLVIRRNELSRKSKLPSKGKDKAPH